MGDYIEEKGSFKDLERVSRQYGGYAAMSTMIEGELGDRLKRSRFRNLTPQETYALELDKFEDKYKLINREDYNYISNTINPDQLRFFNPVALTLGYVLVMYNHEIETFCKQVVESGVNLLDVYRYARYWIRLLKKSNPSVLRSLIKLNKYKSDWGKDDYKEYTVEEEKKLQSNCKKYEEPILEDKNVKPDHIIQITNDPPIQIGVDDNDNPIFLEQLGIYPYDTINTLRQRIAKLIDLPTTFINIKLGKQDENEIKELVVKLKEETIQTINGPVYATFVEESDQNPLTQYKTCVVQSIFDIILEELPLQTMITRLWDEYFKTISEEKNSFIRTKDDIVYLISMFRDLSTSSIYNKEEDIWKEVNSSYDPILFTIIEQKLINENTFTLLRDGLRSYFYKTHSSGELTLLFKNMKDMMSNPLTLRNTIIESTRFNIQGIFELEGKDMDTFELFNRINMSSNVPYASILNFHKVLNGINIPLEFIEDRENDDLFFIIRIKNREQRLISSSKLEKDDFATVRISITDESRTLVKKKYTFEIDTGAGLSQEEMIQYFLETLNPMPTKVQISKKFGRGVMVLSMLKFPRILFSDFCQNHPIASHFLTCDETYSIQRTGGVKFFIKTSPEYQTSRKGKVSGVVQCILNEKTIERTSDQEMKLFPGQFKKNETIFTLTFYGNSSWRDIQMAREIILHLMELIINETSSFYIQYYCHQIVNISKLISSKKEVRLQEVTRTKDNIEEINPGLANKGYRTTCQDQPRILLQGDQIPEEYQTMTFPKLNDISETRPQYTYICDRDPKKIYPGLKVNKRDKNIEHFEQYPLVPCCYAEDQSKSSEKYKYENIEDHTLDDPDSFLEKQIRATGTINTSKAVLSSGQLGKLFGDTLDILNMSSKSTLLGTRNWLREGTKRGPHSILNVLCSIFQKDKESVLSSLINRVNKMENCQSGINQVDSLYILQNELFMNPFEWSSLLSIEFNTEIVLFYYNKNKKIDGIPYPPLYSRMFNKLKTYDNVVFLFIHSGGSYSNLKFLQTEIIHLCDKNKPIQTIFSSANQIGKYIMDTVESMINIYMNTYPFSSLLEIYNQQPDSVGKIREVVVKGKKGPLLLHLPPYASFETKGNYPSSNLVQTETNILSVLPDAKPIQGGFVYNNIISINDDSKEQSLMIPSLLHNELTFFEQYNQYTRSSHILIAYALFLYSNYIDKNGLKVKSNDLSDFVAEYFDTEVVVDASFDIKQILSRELIVNNRLLTTNNGFLRVPSAQIKEKLKYIVLQKTKYHQTYILEYKERKFIPDFYSSSKDFIQGDQYSVYFRVFEYIISRTKQTNKMNVYTILPYSDTSLFFQNPHIANGEIVLVEPIKKQDFNSSIPIGTYLLTVLSETSQLIDQHIISNKGNGIVEYTPEEDYNPSIGILMTVTEGNKSIFKYKTL